MAGTGAQVAVGHVAERRSANAYEAIGMIKQGSRGPGVAAIQRALGLRADGVFGSATARAVRAFQRRNGLAVDGVVGPQTSGALGVAPKQRTGKPRQPATSGQKNVTGGVAPAPPTTPKQRTPAPKQGTPAPLGGGNVPAALRRIAQCESGGNPRAIGGGGTYRGKYQFNRQTWRSLGGKGDPAAASEAEQDRLAMKLYSQAGTAPWANCAR